MSRTVLAEAAEELVAGLDAGTKQELTGVDVTPLFEWALKFLSDAWERRCPRQVPDQVRRNLAVSPRTRATLRSASADAIRQVHGTKRRFGRVAFNRLRDQMADSLLDSIVIASDDRMLRVKAQALKELEG